VISIVFAIVSFSFAKFFLSSFNYGKRGGRNNRSLSSEELVVPSSQMSCHSFHRSPTGLQSAGGAAGFGLHSKQILILNESYSNSSQKIRRSANSIIGSILDAFES